jgi:hypothetical protein
MRGAEQATNTEAIRNAYKILVGSPEGKGSCRRPCRRLDNTKMDLKETGLEGVKWIHLAKDGDCWQAGTVGFHKRRRIT